MITKSFLKDIKSLLQKKNREQYSKYIVEGSKSIKEISIPLIEMLVINNDFEQKEKEFISNYFQKNVKIETISNKNFDSISDTVTSQGVIAIVKKETYNLESLLKNAAKKNRFKLLILDDISDPGNLGTIIRTADWFGIDGIIISNNSVELYNPKVIRSTMGSMFHIPIIVDADVYEVLLSLKNNLFTIYGTNLDGQDYSKIKYESKSAIVFGNESRGVTKGIQNISDKLITIPSGGKAESLNVSVAAGIILSQFIN